MADAVDLVRAYLQVNGYFTVTEYPVMERFGGGHREVTDLDVLAYRFRGAGRVAPGTGRRAVVPVLVEPDPMLATCGPMRT